MKPSPRVLVAVAVLAATSATSVLVAVAVDGAQPPPAPPAVAGRAGPPSQPADEEDGFTPLASPCRIVDTRLTAAKQMNPAETRTFAVSGVAGFGVQGGHAGGCGIPAGATSIAATITAVAASGSGYVRAWPAGNAEPTATVLNYAASGSTGTGATVAVKPESVGSLAVKNYAGKAHVVIDVSGYFQKPLAGTISAEGSTYAGSSRLVGASRVATGIYDVQFDRDLRSCTPTATVFVSSYVASARTVPGTDPTTVRVYVYDTAGVAQNQFFYLSVHC